MIVARGLGQGGEEMVATAGWGVDAGGVTPPVTPLPYGFDYTDRVYRDDEQSDPRQDERIDRS